VNVIILYVVRKITLSKLIVIQITSKSESLKSLLLTKVTEVFFLFFFFFYSYIKKKEIVKKKKKIFFFFLSHQIII
jgi:hypothetical protein